MQQDQQQTAVLAEFQAGVTACLRSWSALKTAVDSGWGGFDSAAKADDLRRLIFEYMAAGKLQEEDLEDNLAIYMEEEFSVTLEDESERQIANLIFRMYEDCAKGDFRLSRQVIETCQRAQVQIAQYPTQIQSTNDDDSDSDDDAMDVSETVESTEAKAAEDAPTLVNVDLLQQQQQQPVLEINAAEYASQPLFGTAKKPKVHQSLQHNVRQLGESTPEPVGPEVDEEGFAAVSSKRKGRR